MSNAAATCPRCLGNANAFARFEVNGGRCLLCNGVGASSAGPVGRSEGKPVTLAFRFPNGWISKDPNVAGRLIVTVRATDEAVAAARMTGAKVTGQAAFVVVDGIVRIEFMANGWKSGDGIALQAALQAALVTA